MNIIEKQNEFMLENLSNFKLEIKEEFVLKKFLLIFEYYKKSYTYNVRDKLTDMIVFSTTDQETLCKFLIKISKSKEK